MKNNSLRMSAVIAGMAKLNLVNTKLSKLRDFANDFANVVIVVTHDKYKDDDDRNC